MLVLLFVIDVEIEPDPRPLRLPHRSTQQTPFTQPAQKTPDGAALGAEQAEAAKKKDEPGSGNERDGEDETDDQEDPSEDESKQAALSAASRGSMIGAGIPGGTLHQRGGRKPRADSSVSCPT